ncbi:amidase family protein [Kordiimonas laminariae]|uniref:amidase family protein n=1 Tax=Kordiimonas laminariae TaxID=2917717 RepID=UPI001FF16E02|nr:amidase family protein [Kordiimonas laminariae]MCK0070605.1 hypothetical protein [Kordiimonas laminariae]
MNGKLDKMDLLTPHYALRFLDAVEIVGLVKEGHLSTQELIECSTRSAEDEQKNIFIRTSKPEKIGLHTDISILNQKLGAVRSMLDGIPIAWKDNFKHKNEPLTAGQKSPRMHPKDNVTAVSVEFAEAAGLIPVGATNMSELAFSGLGLNAHHGTPCNPYSAARRLIPGGSSSGSASAVSMGVVPIGIGTDTSGSVRIPASMQNLVGFKPSFGRYPIEGVTPLAPSLDTIGFLTRSVRDCILLDDIFRGHSSLFAGLTWSQYEAKKRTTHALKKTIFVPENYIWDQASENVVERFEAALTILDEAGYSIVRKEFNVFDRVASLFRDNGTLVAFEAGRLYRDYAYSSKSKSMDPFVVSRLRDAIELKDRHGAMLLSYRNELIKDMNRELAGGMLAMPTVAIDIPTMVDVQKSAKAFHRYNQVCLRNTMLGSFLNLPGVSLPMEMGRKELPAGLLLSANSENDRALLWEAHSMLHIINPQYVANTRYS